MGYKIKNISSKSISLFVVKSGKNKRISLASNSTIEVDAVKTPQIIFFKNKNIISIDEDDKPRPDRIITYDAIMPQIVVEKKEHIETQNKQLIQKDISYIKKEIELNAFDYQKLSNNCISKIFDSNKFYDVNVIIPVRGRIEFAKPMFNSFLKAKSICNLEIAYTIVEYSEIPEHAKFCKENKINYIWIECDSGSLFNKCLSHNMGAMFTVKSKYLIFHDIDCLMQSDFFVNLFLNIKNKGAQAIQNFNERRVLYLSPELTNNVISNSIEVDSLSIEMPDVNPPHLFGAPGGSITIERDLFFKVGGYDPELFLANSPEDIFFWDKVDAVNKMEICDNPVIELYHMYHPPTYMDNPLINDMLELYKTFKDLDVEGKMEIINIKSEMIKNFK